MTIVHSTNIWKLMLLFLGSKPDPTAWIRLLNRTKNFRKMPVTSVSSGNAKQTFFSQCKRLKLKLWDRNFPSSRCHGPPNIIILVWENQLFLSAFCCWRLTGINCILNISFWTDHSLRSKLISWHGKMVLHTAEIRSKLHHQTSFKTTRQKVKWSHVKLHFNAAAKLSKSIHENKLESMMMLIYQNICMRWHTQNDNIWHVFTLTSDAILAHQPRWTDRQASAISQGRHLFHLLTLLIL